MYLLFLLGFGLSLQYLSKLGSTISGFYTARNWSEPHVEGILLFFLQICNKSFLVTEQGARPSTLLPSLPRWNQVKSHLAPSFIYPLALAITHYLEKSYTPL